MRIKSRGYQHQVGPEPGQSRKSLLLPGQSESTAIISGSQWQVYDIALTGFIG